MKILHGSASMLQNQLRSIYSKSDVRNVLNEGFRLKGKTIKDDYCKNPML